MCGINGFTWRDEPMIGRMNEALKYRGPDDSGAYFDDMVSLGHTRLSIIDLSPAGHQPMQNEDGSMWITYNGEVFNFGEIRSRLEKAGHKFRSSSDTEVVLHAYEEYGPGCLAQFNGMWALCIYDKAKGTLFLSRDGFGIKPLYYYMDESRLIFSSMIAGVLCHDVKTGPDERAIMAYLAYNLEDHGVSTFFENIRSLAPDTYMLYDLKARKAEIHKWAPARETPTTDIKGLFEDSVRLRTISDVPVGSCLSGGVDSTAIVCLLDRHLKGDFFTYSLVVPGSPIDESRYIREVGRNTHAKQRFTELREEDFLKDFTDFVRAQEEPVTGLSPYAQYRVMKLAHDNGAKVLLDGQGGDEVFAGYTYYFAYYFYELFKCLRWPSLLKEAAMYRRNFKDAYPFALFAFLMLPGGLKYAAWKRLMNPWVDYGHFERSGRTEKDPRWKRMTLEEALGMTMRSTAIPHLLRYEDKNSMRWSIECRPPFLDHRLVDAASTIPSGQKLKDGRTKVVFKEAMSDVLPPMIRERKDKIGFAAPADRFFRDAEVARMCRSVIASKSFRKRKYWKADAVERMLDEHVSGKKDHGTALWKCLNLEAWLRCYFEEGA